jgi:hypothetical protein
VRKIYAITMWSGGQAAKKWQTYEKPELLPSGTGIRFTCRHTKLSVELIGAISVEEYESGKDDIESIRDRFDDGRPDEQDGGGYDGNRIERLF